MERIYHMPVKVKIDSDNPDRVMRGIAEAIYDAVAKHTCSREFNAAVRFCDVEYSVFIKADAEYVRAGVVQTGGQNDQNLRGIG